MENKYIDDAIKNRRTVRQFSEVIPDKKDIEDIIEAGRLAPYAGLANKGTVDFRRFFVFSRESEELKKIDDLIMQNVKQKMEAFEKSGNKAFEPMLKGMKMFLEMGSPIGNSPWYIITAERKGFPPREQQALAHCLENMWLKATSLGLGLQLVSAINDLQDNEEFNEILGLKTGEFAFDSCLIGYPKTELTERIRKEPELSIKWFE